jgi:hypothetical protein
MTRPRVIEPYPTAGVKKAKYSLVDAELEARLAKNEITSPVYRKNLENMVFINSRNHFIQH